MIAIALVAGLLCVSALVTLVCSRLIERAHPPRGRFVEIDGRRQHVVDLNNASDQHAASAFVLLHGAGSNLEDMHVTLGERLAARRRVILVDRPGQGWSERSYRVGSSPAHQAQTLRQLLDRLGIERAVVVGHSWGGTMAVAFALDHPDRIAGLVLLSPPTHPRFRRLSRLYTVLAMPFAGWLFARTLAMPLAAAAFGIGVRAPFLPQVPPRGYLKRGACLLLLRPAMFLANARDIAGLQRFLAGQVPRYETLAVPTLVVTGDSDRVVSPQHHAMAFSALVPAAKLMVLPGVGHMPHHAAADQIVAAIEELAAR